MVVKKALKINSKAENRPVGFPKANNFEFFLKFTFFGIVNEH